MKILADENLNGLFIADLRRAGYEVLSIREELGGIADPEVAALASGANALLITEDKDFGELIFAYQTVKITIVFLRYRKAELEMMRRQLQQAIEFCKEKEGHFFITIARGKIRITEL
jgi:predicted nuclease of predicted toxin-antitoxin system